MQREGCGTITSDEIYYNVQKYIYGQFKERLGPTSESQVTSIKIGGKTISARYSSKRMYDVRLDDANGEIRSRSAVVTVTLDRNSRFSIEGEYVITAAIL